MLFKADGYSELIQSFKLSLQVDDLKAQTIKHYTSDTKKFLEHISAIPPDDISPNHVRQYLDSLRARVSPKTIYEVQLALRKFFRFMSEEGRLNPIHTLTLSPSRTMSDEVDLSRRSPAVHQAGAPSGVGVPASSHGMGPNVSMPLSVSYQILGQDSLS